MNTNKTILSICNRCRDGREEELKTRGGQRFLDNFLNKMATLIPLAVVALAGPAIIALVFYRK